MPSLLDFAQNHMALANDSHSNTTSGPLHLPFTVLDPIIPGVSLIASFLLALGVDASLFVSWIAIIAAGWAALRFGLAVAWDSIVRALSSCVVVDEYDPIYNHVLTWASSQKNLQDIRSLRTQTAGQYYDAFDDGYEEEDNHQLQMRESMSEDMIFNFNNWSARAPPQYRPHASSGWFLHKHHLFRLYRGRDRVAGEIGLVYEKERLDIAVLWLSPKPVKKLIEEAREFVLARRTSTTTIRRPTPKSQRNSRQQAWTTMANRPSRSMATVVLDVEQKTNILRDFNEFLHPRTARWYSNRGIPYRRGYLFHGPPGTGKTSLTFALAGVFGLDIYSLALSEATLTEEDLVLLFNSLPKRCIILLEDVDTAGLGRALGDKLASKQVSSRSSSSTNDRHKTAIPPNPDEQRDSQNPAIARGQLNPPNVNAKEPTFKNTLTLSGLLNAIDGVASQEGRVLIMTTNHPERLDPALTRPGRVDLTVKFELANGQQIKDLFLRMYCGDTLEMRRQPTKISQMLPDEKDSGELEIQASTIGHNEHKDDSMHPEKIVSPASSAISRLAEDFTRALPEHTFSPAEIQGFLLVRKKDPAKAVADIPRWRDDQVRKRSQPVAKKSGDSNFSTENTNSSVGQRTLVLNGDTGSKCNVHLSVNDSEHAGCAARTNPEGTVKELESDSTDPEIQDTSTSDRKGPFGNREQKTTNVHIDERTDGAENGEQCDGNDQRCDGTSDDDDNDGVQTNGGEHDDSDDPGSDHDEGRPVMRIWSHPRGGGSPRIIFGPGHSL